MAETPLEDRDFRTIGMAWIVRRRNGDRQRYYTLGDLREARELGDVDSDDSLSCDGVTWWLIGRIEDIDALFEETWQLSADENASVLQINEKDSFIIDEPSVRLKFVPLPEPKPKPPPRKPRKAPAPTPPPAPDELDELDEPTGLQLGIGGITGAAILAAAAGVLAALAVASLVYAVYGP